jgi:CheY-like chemotaxis protein
MVGFQMTSITGVSEPNNPLRLALPPILVADDDEDDLFFTVRLIKRTGTKHPVMTFDDGAGVVDYLSRAWLTQPDEPQLLPRLLFLDLKMQGLGGFGFLEWIQEHRELSALNVVVLSGSDEPQDVERAKKLGAKRYLAKHPGLATFTTIVQSVHASSSTHGKPFPRDDEEFFAAGSPEWNDQSAVALQRRRD